MGEVVNLYLPGNLDNCDSYGLLACELLRGLSNLGAYVNMIALGQRNHANQTADVAALAQKPIRATAGGILLGWPSTYASQPAMAQMGPRVALTMFESSCIPPTWADTLNTLDAVITPSLFCADVFKTCGVTVPIHVVPLGVGDVYKPYRRRLGRKMRRRPVQHKMTFLAFLDRGERKGGIAAQQAFSLAFGDDRAYHLILKMRKPKVVVNVTNPNMTMIQRDMNEHELYELYCRCHVLINPNMGEGFGLIPREFAATGGVALATNWGGTADQIDEWGWPLPYTLGKAEWRGAPSFKGLDLGQWAIPDIEGIAKVLRNVADRREFYCTYAAEAAADVRALYSWQDFATQVLEIYQGVANGWCSRLSAT